MPRYYISREKGHITLSKLVSLMSAQPAKISAYRAVRYLWAPADIILFDPNEKWVVKPELLQGKSKNTPFKGMVLEGRVKTPCSAGGLYIITGK